MRNISRSRRLLSLLLCLAMFLSLGFTAYAQPDTGTIEPVQGQIQPVDGETEQEMLLPAQTEAEGEASFALTTVPDPFIFENPGMETIYVTVSDLQGGAVSGICLNDDDDDYVENMQAEALKLYFYEGELEDENGNVIPVSVGTSSAGPFEIGSSAAFGFSVDVSVSQRDWENAAPGIYGGYLMYAGTWIGHVNGVEKEVFNTQYYDAIELVAVIVDPEEPYRIAIEQSFGGTITADKDSAKVGETVTLTAAPDTDCSLEELLVTDWQGRSVPLQQSGDTWTFTMPAFGALVTPVWHLGWFILQNVIDEAENDSVIKLNQDFTAGEGDSALVIPVGNTLSIDLNGHTLDRNLTEAKDDGNVITNNGFLTILDSSEEKTGRITGGNSTGSGGAVVNNGNLTVEGGSFSDNSAKEAGAIYNPAGSVLTINDGQFTHNNATVWGGGAVVNYGTMTMNDGDIYSNSVPMNGGGIWTAGSLTMNGGAVAGNKAGDNGGGVFFREGSFHISGSPLIYDNTAGGRKNNVFLRSGITIEVSDPLERNTWIGVTSDSSGLPKRITSGLSGNISGLVSDYFFSDDETLRCALDDNGELILVSALYKVRIDSNMQGGTVTPDKTEALQGETVILTVTPDEGMKLKELKYLCDGDSYYSEVTQGEDGSYTFTMPAFDLTVFADFVPDVEEYMLSVGGVQVTAANKDNIFGDSGTPRATYDPETFTLTLNTASLPMLNGDSCYIQAYKQDLVIVTKRALTIDASQNGYYPIEVNYGSLTLKGDITVKTQEENGIEVYGIDEGQGNLVVDGKLTVTAINEYVGNPYHSVSADAILVSKDVTVMPGSTLTARSESEYALYTYSGTVRILGGTVSLSSTRDDCLSCAALVMEGGTVTLVTSEDDDAAYVRGDVTISGGSLTANGEYGLHVVGNMTMTGGKVTASGDDYGVSVGGKLLVDYGIESLTGEGSSHGIQADEGIELGPYVIVQEPQGAVLNEYKTEFVIPGSEEDVTRVVLVTDPNAPSLYRVILDDSIPAGSVTADKTRAALGETVTLTVTDLAGGELFAEYVDFRNQTYSVPIDENTWTFTMPDYDVTVSIKYKASAVYPYGRTGIQILSLLTGTLLEQEGLDEIYARPGDTITVQIRTEYYYSVKTLILEYQENGATVTQPLTVSYNSNTGSYNASFSMPRTAVTISVTMDTSRPWMALQAQFNTAENGAVISLIKDTTAELGNAALLIPAGKSFTLDLAGFTLDRGRADRSAGEEGNVITVNGSLTIIDSSEEKTGLITGGNNTGSGGGIYVGGTLTIEGGAISGNTTEKWGGGVYLAQNAVLNLAGGVIENNSCVNNGGGIHISESASLNVCGDPAVTGNRKGDSLQNVNLANGALIHVTGTLEGARIGVSVSSNNEPTEGNPRPITTGLSGNGTGVNFFSDNEDFYVWVIDGEANLLVQDLTRDINEDGKVNALDLLVLRKKLVELPIEGNFDPEAADLNGDGNIDILDLVRLRKILGQ